MASINDFAFGSGGKLLQGYVNGTTAVINEVSNVVTNPANHTVCSFNHKCVLFDLQLGRGGTFISRAPDGTEYQNIDVAMTVELTLDGKKFTETFTLSGRVTSGSRIKWFSRLFITTAYSSGGLAIKATYPAKRNLTARIISTIPTGAYAGHTLVSAPIVVEYKGVY